MKKFFKKIILIFLTLILNTVNIVYADASDIYDLNNNNGIAKAGAYIAGWIRYGAMVIAVVMLMSKGIKFITASPEGKAEVKKEMTPWAIGLILLLLLNVIINFVAGLAQNHVNQITV